MGYSVRELNFISIDNTHELLFKGFFDIDNIKNRLKKEYQDFCNLQSQKLFHSEYDYVEPSYLYNNGIGCDHLIDCIISQIKESGAQLIILEAAAGYGKTCTSYELINKISQDERFQCAPIFTELSKNRKAALFRYVLLDEIDKKFTSLSSKLVVSEIQEGNVPLIIDGFDELISKSNKGMLDPDGSQEDDSQTMLDTIADLFEAGCNTKVVLTSRKSAIFTGDIFEEWVKSHLIDCTVTRISIEEPTIQDWIGYDRKEFLEKQRIPFGSILNPILLAFMRSMTDEEFEKTCSDVESVITYYFQSLLEREKERQSLQLSEGEQYKIMKEFALEFAEFDIVAEELAFVRDVFLEIIHENFAEYRDRYLISAEKPTEEQFASKLAGHALLNRISPTKNQIGFINDFVFGIFIGDSLISDPMKITQMERKFIEMACVSYASRSEDKRKQLFDVVKPHMGMFNYEQQFGIEIKLASTICQNYTGHYFSNFSFNSEVYFEGSFIFSKCTFRNCTFLECVIMASAFQECSFYNCRFYNVTILRDTTQNCRLFFSGNCVGYEKWANEASYEEEESISETNYEKIILQKYWGVGERFSKGRLPEIVLLKTMNPDERSSLQDALESLKRKNLISKEGHYWFLNLEKVNDIKEILEI